MKKVSLFVFSLLLAGASAFAQDDRTPKAGNFSVELNLNLLNGRVADNFEFNNFTKGLKARYFFTDQIALRFGLGFNSERKEILFNEKADGTGANATITKKSSTFQITPGLEYHFVGGEKLSPYVGFDFFVGFNNKSEERSNTDGDPANGFNDKAFTLKDNISVENGQMDFDSKNNANIFLPATTTVGARLVTGVDYFFASNVFIGAEFGLGFNNVKEKDVTVTALDDSMNKTTTVKELGDKTSNFGFELITGFRLGWLFGTGSSFPRNR